MSRPDKLHERPKERPAPGDPAHAVHDLAERLQTLAEHLHRTGQAGLGAVGHGLAGVADPWVSLLDALAAQTTVPVTQLQALADGIHAQRDQMKALQTQLAVFDRQLSVLEDALLPLVTWGQQWVRVQEAVLGRIHAPGD